MAPGHTPTVTPAWWQTAVFYQVYPRSFADSNGDGIGDLAGVLSRLDYLAETLGVDALWLSPFYPSPQLDFGYDVSDHCGVDPAYGSLDDFDVLLSEAHRRGLRVIVDYVINHTSDRHPWFLASRSSRRHPRRDWYLWRDASEDGSPPNNWVAAFGGSAWQWDAATAQYYLHSFLAEQPDLNWRNPEVHRAMLEVLRFWMERGVDGFRIDVAHRALKDPLLRDNPPAAPGRRGGYKVEPEYASQQHLHDVAHPDIHRLFRELRTFVDSHHGDGYLVGEIHEYRPDRWASYYGEALDELHQVFNFALLAAGLDAERIRAAVAGVEAALPAGAWPTWVLGNHDEPRIVTRFGWEASRAAAVLLLTLRGTPTLYQGDEIGMEDAAVPPERQQDPWGRRKPGFGRDGCRTPMQWTAGQHAGFGTGGRTWLPVHPSYRERNVEVELDDPDSHLELYRRLLRLRRSSPALRRGGITLFGETDNPLIYRRRLPGAPAAWAVLNLSAEAGAISFPGPVGLRVRLSTHRDREGTILEGGALLRPWEALVAME